jgi:hypothetical protein
MWLDTLVSVPTVGLQMVPTFAAYFRYAALLEPMLDEIISREPTLELGIDPKTATAFTFRTTKGWAYTVGLDAITIQFAYRTKEQPVAGGLAVPEAPKIEPFSSLAEEAITQLARVLSHLANEKPKVRRFGLLVNTIMKRSDAPPGVTDMIAAHSSFFGGPVIKSDATFLANMITGGDHTDRCHHSYSFDDTESPDHISVKLDWQRVFKTALRFPSSASEQLRPLKDEALKYFERFGQGGLKNA